MTGEEVTVWPVIKWVIVVLLAGFIGQFGKAMAKGVMEWMRRWRRTGDLKPIVRDVTGDDESRTETKGALLENVFENTNGRVTDDQMVGSDPAKGYGKTLLKLEKKQAKKKAKLEKKLSKGKLLG